MKTNWKIFVLIIFVSLLQFGCATSKGPYNVNFANSSPLMEHPYIVIKDAREFETKKLRIKESNAGKTYYFGDSDFIPVPLEVINKKLKNDLANRIGSGTFTLEEFEFTMFEHAPPSAQEIINNQSKYSSPQQVYSLPSLMAVPIIQMVNPGKGDSWVSCHITGNFDGKPVSARYGEFVGRFGMEDHVNSILNQVIKDLADEIVKK